MMKLLSRYWLFFFLMWWGPALPPLLFAFDRDYDSKDPTRLWVVEADSWQEKLSGTLNISGLNADLETDGNFADCPRVALRMVAPISAVNNAVVTWNTFEHSGRFRKEIDFKGQRYAWGAKLHLQTSLFELTGARELTKFPGAYLEGLYGVKIAQVAAEVKGHSSLGAYQAGSWDNFFPIPFLGVAGGSRVSQHIQLRGSFKLIFGGAAEGLLHSYDADLGAVVRLNRDTSSREWNFLMGYRHFVLDANCSDGDIGIGYSGPLFGLLLRFH